MMHRLTASIPLLLLAVTWAACSSSTSHPAATTPAPAATATVPSVAFATSTVTFSKDDTPAEIHVEVASTPEQSERGLGYRDTLAEAAGMLFDLHETKIPQFWMKGMRFPLDMVWIGDDKRVMSITTAVPVQLGAPDAELVRQSPPLPIRYVLEVNAGAARRLGLAEGKQLTFDLPAAR